MFANGYGRDDRNVLLLGLGVDGWLVMLGERPESQNHCVHPYSQFCSPRVVVVVVEFLDTNCVSVTSTEH